MRGDRRGVRLSVFKGRTRQLTKAIFWTLTQKAPSTAYDLCKGVRARKELKRTRYSVVNRRVRTLEELGYVRKIGTTKTKAGFEVPLYQLTSRAYLAIMLTQIDLDDFMEQADEAVSLAMLGLFSSSL